MYQLPQLSTDRLLLRRIELNDIPALLKHANNPKIAEQIFNIDYPYTAENAVARMHFVYEALKKEDRFIFAIVHKEDNELMGEIGLHLDGNYKAEMGYWISESYWGQGLVTEAIAAALQFGFTTLNLHKIFATHFVGNEASGRAMIKNGMIKEAKLKDHYLYNNAFQSLVQYRLTKDEYAELHSSK